VAALVLAPSLAAADEGVLSKVGKRINNWANFNLGRLSTLIWGSNEAHEVIPTKQKSY